MTARQGSRGDPGPRRAAGGGGFPVVGALVVMVLLAVAGGLALLATYQWKNPDKKIITKDGDGLRFFDSTIRIPLPRRNPQEVDRIVYLNREGATLTGGTDEANKNTSGVLAVAGRNRIAFPAFSGSAKRWHAIADCVRGIFAPYGVRVVETRPVDTDDYVMAMIGGKANLLGRDSKVSGLAPFNGKPIRRAVVFIFAEEHRNATTSVCNTVAQEIGHAFGLDHTFKCEDAMTYIPGCGVKSFVDEDLPCGESEPRDCHDGTPTQNSHAMLMEALGPPLPELADDDEEAPPDVDVDVDVSAGDGHDH